MIENETENSACNSITSEKVARQIEAVSGSLSRQLKRNCDLTEEDLNSPANIVLIVFESDTYPTIIVAFL